jgi:parvulin-like peptidyl-prolyl isomerase
MSLLLAASLVRAQEGQKTLDEIIARVNSAVILRSAYDRAQGELLEELKGRGLKDAELEKQFNELKPVILDGLIDTELLSQRAKDLTIDVEPQVNQQLLRVMKDNNLPSLEDLEQKMREVGVDIQEVRRMLRNRFASEAVRNREVFGKIYHALTEKEKRDYYEQHKELFTTPGEVTLSRIFILSGKEPAQALERAKSAASQARTPGVEFAALAKRISEEELGKKGGQIGQLKTKELASEVRAVVGEAPVGTITDPIKLDTAMRSFVSMREKSLSSSPLMTRKSEMMWRSELPMKEAQPRWISTSRRCDRKRSSRSIRGFNSLKARSSPHQ